MILLCCNIKDNTYKRMSQTDANIRMNTNDTNKEVNYKSSLMPVFISIIRIHSYIGIGYSVKFDQHQSR